MNQHHFNKLLRNPDEILNIDSESLLAITTQFPYCQTVQLLFCAALFNEQSFHFPARLKLAAAYAGDRRILKDLTDRCQALFSSAIEQDTVIESIEKGVGVEHVDVGLNDNVSENSPVITLVEENKEVEAIHSNELIPALSKAEIIDQFIEKAPRITRSRSDFYNPIDYARSSAVDKEDIVSETLAKIYYDQGNYLKAIKIYEKLSLIIPEKSSYFAGLIKKIKSENNLNI